MNTIGTVRVACCNGPKAAAPEARMTSGASATNSAAYLRVRSGSPAPQRMSIRSCGRRSSPNSCSPCERREAACSFRIVRGAGS